MPQSPYARYGSTTITGTQQTMRRHVVGGGETMWHIAASEYGIGFDSTAWRRIAEYNAIDDLDAVAVGASLVIPPLPASET